MAAHYTGDEWQYHQDGRDSAAALGFWCIVAFGMLLIICLGAVIASVAMDGVEMTALAEEAEQVKKMDGSTAGANAVTLEDFEKMAFRDEFAEGMYSVTLQDLERKAEDGGTYPANGKNTPLKSDSTYGKGAGMVDIITWDKSTNAAIRHFGQVQEDGSIRWYAAQYVFDEEGKPVVVPRG